MARIGTTGAADDNGSAWFYSYDADPWKYFIACAGYGKPSFPGWPLAIFPVLNPDVVEMI
jgi:hypothetical protein